MDSLSYPKHHGHCSQERRFKDMSLYQLLLQYADMSPRTIQEIEFRSRVKLVTPNEDLYLPAQQR